MENKNQKFRNSNKYQDILDEDLIFYDNFLLDIDNYDNNPNNQNNVGLYDEFKDDNYKDVDNNIATNKCNNNGTINNEVTNNINNNDENTNNKIKSNSITIPNSQNMLLDVSTIESISNINNFKTNLLFPHVLEINFEDKKYKISSSFTDSEVNHDENIICGNCNGIGHYYKNCPQPLNSYGVICYKKERNNYKIILVRRKDTIGYVELLRGKYEINDDEYIKILFNTMTECEKKRIQKYKNFDKLRELVGLGKDNNIYRIEYNNAKEKFNKILYKIEIFIKNSEKKWFEPEWGFPKGRRHFKESDIDCSIREFSEETLIKYYEISVLSNIKPLEEIYKSFNGVTYRHIYYFCEYTSDKQVKIDPQNNQQAIEISDIRWVDFNEGIKLIRSYHNEKQNILKKSFQILHNMNKYFSEVDY